MLIVCALPVPDECDLDRTGRTAPSSGQDSNGWCSDHSLHSLGQTASSGLTQAVRPILRSPLPSA